MNSATREYARLPSPRHHFHAYIISRGFSFNFVWVARASSGFFKEETAEFKLKIQKIVSGKLYHFSSLVVIESF
jgi:hypothetical protein